MFIILDLVRSGTVYASNSLIHSKVESSNTSRLEAHAGFFRLLMKGILDPYVLSHFDKIVARVRTRDYTVFKRLFDLSNYYI